MALAKTCLVLFTYNQTLVIEFLFQVILKWFDNFHFIVIVKVIWITFGTNQVACFDHWYSTTPSPSVWVYDCLLLQFRAKDAAICLFYFIINLGNNEKYTYSYWVVRNKVTLLSKLLGLPSPCTLRMAFSA